MIAESLPPPQAGTERWQDAGRRIAPELQGYSAVVIAASDPVAAAHVALGIGTVEAERRRVAIGDLVGELQPLNALVTGDDPHGISDSFSYGVSLNRIARQVGDTGNLFIMPSGTGPVTNPEIFRNGRWQRLANGFREVGALLLLVTRADAPEVEGLIAQLEGVVLVGASELDFATEINVLARVPAPARPAARSPVTVAPTRARPIRPWHVAAPLVLLAVLAGAFAWSRWSGETLAPKVVTRPVPRAAAPGRQPAQLAPRLDSIAVPPVANMMDSVAAATFAVQLLASNTPESAAAAVRRFGAQIPAATVSPVPMGPERITWYRVITGAYRDQPSAERLLRSLRRRRLIADTAGSIVRVPFALLVDSATRPAGVRVATQSYAAMGQTVYGLMQADGVWLIYAGAFATPAESVVLADALRASQADPVLVYRTGNVR